MDSQPRRGPLPINLGGALCLLALLTFEWVGERRSVAKFSVGDAARQVGAGEGK